jgi:hypothetical protein
VRFRVARRELEPLDTTQAVPYNMHEAYNTEIRAGWFPSTFTSPAHAYLTMSHTALSGPHLAR